MIRVLIRLRSGLRLTPDPKLQEMRLPREQLQADMNVHTHQLLRWQMEVIRSGWTHLIMMEMQLLRSQLPLKLIQCRQHCLLHHQQTVL